MLKLASPGVPDFYQGTEFWDLTLVDPDNRRPVDYDARAAFLQAVRPLLEGDCEPEQWNKSCAAWWNAGPRVNSNYSVPPSP